ncbi:MAG: thiamine-phosphate kinase [Gammaproteobacteria bacterium RIFCSPHIGHO2_12_FULL_37_14]|nr:MAG: thiamine-phosphate kinase [Gammaproteobacteria bacterium RIFCSPHIGHO2_12_FULL_37_14]
MHEFDIIKKYFTNQTRQRSDVNCGIGDDAAIVTIPSGQELIITTDTLVAGVHFPLSTSPYDIGYKSLAVNLSDLAAMGATPAWITLALTLEHYDEHWLQEFSRGLFMLANDYQIQLIGGDLTHGPLSITIQAFGFTPTCQALLRKNAKPDDLIYVTGTLGDAGLALHYLKKNITLNEQDQHYLLNRLNQPEPRVAIGESLRNIAHAAIDISDGLAADLSHILEQSELGAILYVDTLPLSPALTRALSNEEAIALALTAGDDYELCFTVPAIREAKLIEKLASQPCQYTCIGKITAQTGLTLNYQDGRQYHGATSGYQHF